MTPGIPVFDAVTHTYNLAPLEHTGTYGDAFADLFYRPGMANMGKRVTPAKEEHLRDWSIEETSCMVFAEAT